MQDERYEITFHWWKFRCRSRSLDNNNVAMCLRESDLVAEPEHLVRCQEIVCPVVGSFKKVERK